MLNIAYILVFFLMKEQSNQLNASNYNSSFSYDLQYFFGAQFLKTQSYLLLYLFLRIFT